MRQLFLQAEEKAVDVASAANVDFPEIANCGGNLDADECVFVETFEEEEEDAAPKMGADHGRGGRLDGIGPGLVVRRLVLLKATEEVDGILGGICASHDGCRSYLGCTGR